MELDKEERRERWGSEQRGRKRPAGLNWPFGELGYLYTWHLNMMEGGGGGAEKP